MIPYVCVEGSTYAFRFEGRVFHARVHTDPLTGYLELTEVPSPYEDRPDPSESPFEAPPMQDVKDAWPLAAVVGIAVMCAAFVLLAFFVGWVA